MKKSYIFTLLLAFCFSNLSFGQEMLLNGDFENWDDDTTPTSWTKVENITKESTEIHGGSFSAKHVGGTKKLAQTIEGVIAGNSYTMTLWYKVTGGDDTDARIWSYWKNAAGDSVNDADTDASLRGPSNGYLDNNGGVWTKYEVTVIAPAEVTKLYFELRTYGSATVYYDDLSFVNNTVVSNQVVLEDFEGTAPVLSTENGVTATIAANPTVSAEKSMKIVTGAGQSWQGGKLMMQTNKIDMRTSDKTLSVKIWSDAARDFLLKLTDGDGGAGNDSKTYVAHSGSGWETLNADFSVSADTGQGGIVANDQYSGLTFYPLYNNNGTTAGGWYAIPDPAYTNYIDDISGIAGDAIGGDSAATVLEDFESAAPVLSAENGVTATIAANPTISAEKSMKIVTGAGQSWQGGKLMMQTNKIDMRTSDKTLSVKIWSDAARDFLLKLTDGDGGAGNDSKTYVAHTGSGWGTLIADFSVSADTGQGGIVANDQYSGLTFYPLYNNNGTTAGGWYAIPDPAYTNYIDDITGIAGDAVTVDTCSNGIQDGDETGIDCGGSCGPCPAEPTDAPTTPIARNDWDVISIYSDAYASTGLTDVTWDEGTLSTEVTIASNNVLKVDFNNFLGTELSGGGVDATDMTHFHMDYWVADDFAAGQVFNPKLSNHAASAGETGAKLYTVALGAEDNKKWLSLDVELGTDFERNNILQFLLTTSATVKVGYIDNIYMYRAATASVGNNELLNISMYPNPVSDRLNISAQSTIKSAAIYNLLGKKVMSLEINKNSESINVSGLASGMYLIKYSLDNAIGTAKFIKQ